MDVLRIGRISSFNYPKGTAKIAYEDRHNEATAEFSFLCNAWQYWMPEIGDQVLVAHLSNGSSSAVILGPVWHDEWRPTEGAEDLYRREYNKKPGLGYERYDAKKQEYGQHVTGKADIESTDTWTLKVGSALIEVNPDGTVNITAPAGIHIDTPLIKVTGDVEAGNNAISLVNHVHTSKPPEEDTSPPKP